MGEIVPFVSSHERFVDRNELASIMGVCPRTISKFVSEGMPSESWGLRARRFRPSVCIAWASQRRGAA
jgi:phage terminase Nu1 subunit (DNA packaging protein)